jgi:hypothetical protein
LTFHSSLDSFRHPLLIQIYVTDWWERCSSKCKKPLPAVDIETRNDSFSIEKPWTSGQLGSKSKKQIRPLGFFSNLRRRVGAHVIIRLDATARDVSFATACPHWSAEASQVLILISARSEKAIRPVRQSSAILVIWCSARQ